MLRLNNDVSGQELKMLQLMLNSAKRKYEEAQKAENEIFDYLEVFGINEPDTIHSFAENADNVQEAISCYLNYGEYSVKGIIDDIRRVVNVNE